MRGGEWNPYLESWEHAAYTSTITYNAQHTPRNTARLVAKGITQRVLPRRSSVQAIAIESASGPTKRQVMTTGGLDTQQKHRGTFPRDWQLLIRLRDVTGRGLSLGFGV